MKRTTWEFPFETAIVFAAAQNKERHHQERYDFWLGEFKKADNDWRQGEEQFKSSTFDSSMSYSNQPLQNRVQHCRNKVQTHNSLRREYAIWQRVLAKSSETHLQLNQDDVIYFGLVDENSTSRE